MSKEHSINEKLVIALSAWDEVMGRYYEGVALVNDLVQDKRLSVTDREKLEFALALSDKLDPHAIKPALEVLASLSRVRKMEDAPFQVDESTVEEIDLAVRYRGIFYKGKKLKALTEDEIFSIRSWLY